MTQPFDCLIIGAGISGLLAGAELQKAGQNILIVDKARGVGGRMATRRKDGFAWDHGAQFARFRSAAIQDYLPAWTENNLLKLWFSSGSEPAWIGTQGMTSLPKGLAERLPVQLNCKVTSIRPLPTGWEVLDEGGGVYKANSLLITAPLPQALALLAPLDLEESLLENLSSIQYFPCLALLISLAEGTDKVPASGLSLEDHAVISWMADNQKKGISDRPSLTLHASPVWSERYFEADEAVITKLLLKFAADWIPSASLLNTQLMRWRYSLPQSQYTELFCKASATPHLLLAGDAFGGPRVEGAMLSGLAAAEWLIQNQ
ncbi:NAD(P)/FAD-dependent oxidoreductase [Vampirovibrio sp.]|uniref:NAD(P)/FAD-dependent oxidoreductase n=1 Tax=Vampirovibrio sp. TaxID=2717857 RepID=UPI0035935B6D